MEKSSGGSVEKNDYPRASRKLIQICVFLIQIFVCLKKINVIVLLLIFLDFHTIAVFCSIQNSNSLNALMNCLNYDQNDHTLIILIFWATPITNFIN